MKIFSAQQVKNWDNHTINSEPVSSIDLMERSAQACSGWIIRQFPNREKVVRIFCGKGNNGGDGLAIARLLSPHYRNIIVCILESPNNESKDFLTNLERLKGFAGTVNFIEDEADIPGVAENDVVIDALVGTGLNKAITGLAEALINSINSSGAAIISIDLPSGLFPDISSLKHQKITANHTLTFEATKVALLMDENAPVFGNVTVLPIGLDKNFADTEKSNAQLVDSDFIKSVYKPRNAHTHKGHYGHACLVVGHRGMMGAGVLAAKACMRTGTGKLTAHIPQCGVEIMQISAPEAMVSISGSDKLGPVLPAGDYDAMAVGPGIGLHDSHASLLYDLFTAFGKPMVIDADALNVLSSFKRPLLKVPAGSILTPHTKEFERLFGKSDNDFDRMDLALKKAHMLNCYIVLKGHHTLIATPSGHAYFNNTGNAGMATAGSGDVLTGILTGLLAQGYCSLDAALLGVYLHGLAGDIGAAKLSKEALIAGDIIEHLGEAFLQISN